MKKLFALSLLLTAGGCQEYIERTDFTNPNVGDAVARNASNQTIDPWPRYVYDTDIVTSGRRQDAAIKKYHAGPIPANTAASPTPIILAPAPAPQ